MYEYKVIAAPLRAPRIKGTKTAGERFAHGLTEALNALAAEGWEYLRAETLPCEERKGLTGTRRTEESVLVFRRALDTALDMTPAQAAPSQPGVAVHEPTLVRVWSEPEARPTQVPAHGHGGPSGPVPFRADPVLRMSLAPGEGGVRPEPTLRKPRED